MQARVGLWMALIMCLVFSSCKPARESHLTESATSDFQRFVPIPSPTPLFEGVAPGNVALDTKTGNLCKTWDWNEKSSALDGLPECQKVYATYARDR